MTQRRKLIEVALPLDAINTAGYQEQTVKQGKPTQMHKWFAGRPMVTARAVIWASLVDDPSSDASLSMEEQDRERARLFSVLEGLLEAKASPSSEQLRLGTEEVRRCFPDGLPALIDPFGGGGAIPLEAQRLGLDVISSDLNPVAVILQRALLSIPHHFVDRPQVSLDNLTGRVLRDNLELLASDLELMGDWVRKRAEERLAAAYETGAIPNSDGFLPTSWIWARTIQSPDPTWNGNVPLVKSWWLSKKSGIWIQPSIDRRTQQVSFVVKTSGEPTVAPTIKRGIGTCIATGATIDKGYIQAAGEAGQIGRTLMAVVGKQRGVRGRVYRTPERTSATDNFGGVETWFAAAPMSTHSQYMGPPKYGMREWYQLFNERQLQALKTFIDLVLEARTETLNRALECGFSADPTPLHAGGTGAIAYSDAIATYLAFAVNRLADWNNTSCGWDSSNSVNQHMFTRQAIPMMWDYCEIRPFDSAAGSFANSISTIATAIRALAGIEATNTLVLQRDCRAVLNNFSGAMVSTDPPYYDAVPYSDISDFFHVLFRMTLGDVWPTELSTIATPKAEELVADYRRHGGKPAAAKFFESGMLEFMNQLRTSHHETIPTTIYYAYKSTESASINELTSTGWSTFLQAVIDSGLAVTATWPLRTENPSRLRAIGSNALSSTVVLVCRPREISAQMATRSEFVAALRAELPEAVRVLQSGNIAPVDIPQSTIGPGIGVFSRFARVVESDGSMMSVSVALTIINDVLGEILDGEESEMDADSRFALSWYSQFGFNPGSSGDADGMARAKNTSVAGVAAAGVGEARAGKFRLFERSELAPGWSPLKDDRPTVWEATQYLIAALERSESEAAELLHQLGGYGERARVLAYLLFKKATDKGWAEEAGAYNGLIVAWPALQVASAPTTQQSMELG